MKFKFIKLLGAAAVTVGLIACPAPNPEDFTFTLDKYEVKAGEEITVNTGKVRAFEEPNSFYILRYTKMKEVDGKQVAVLDEETSMMKLIEHSDPTHAKFKVPEDAVTGFLKLDLKEIVVQNECYDYENNGWYASYAYSDKKLVIVK